METKNRKVGWILCVIAAALCAAAWLNTSAPPRTVVFQNGLGAETTNAPVEPTAPAPEILASAQAADVTRELATATASRATRAASTNDSDGDATIGSEHECDALESTPASTRESPRIAGAIRGILLREGGPWTAETLPKPNMVMLDLVASNPVHENRRGLIEARTNSTGALELVFEFEDVPEGEYELTLSALGSWRWSPVTLRVKPPLDGVTFTRYDKDEKLKLAFEVSDAALGTKLESFEVRHVQLTPSRDNGVFLHTGPLNVDEFPLDARFTWSLWAAGYAPVFGDETAFVRRDATRVAHVELARGWSTRVLVLARDPAARQVERAEVLVDGVRAGFTGADGTLVVRAPARPATLDVRYAGWKTAANPLLPFEGRTAEQRGQITIVMLDRE